MGDTGTPAGDSVTATAAKPATASRTLGYHPGLDSLRAIAVIAVLLFHGTPGLVPGGFLGVDVFFVLSGFLITTILFASVERRGSPVTVDFWIRRARRLLPAFLVMVLLISAITMSSGDIVRTGLLRTQGFASILYVYNWYEIHAEPFVLTRFSHTWSLSIEEQWYLVWPFLFAGLLVVTRRRASRLLVAVLVLALCSFLLMVAFRESDPARASVGTDTRAWQLLAGSALAVAWSRWGLDLASRRVRRAVNLAAVGALGVLVWAFATATEVEQAASAWVRLAVVAATLTMVVAAVQQEPSPLRRAMSVRPLVAVGLISYGLYLYHMPLYGLVDRDHLHFDGAPLLLARLAVTVAFAALSYRFVERPLRHGAGRPVTTATFVIVTTVTVATVTGVFLYATAHPAPVVLGRLVLRDFRTLAADTPAGATRVLVAGDESAAALTRNLPQPVSVGGILGAVATSPCGILPGRSVEDLGPPCRPWTDVGREAVAGFRPQVTVLMTGSHELSDRRVRGRLVRASSPEATAQLRAGLERSRRILTADGAPMIVTTVPCTDPSAVSTRNDPRLLAWFNTTVTKFAAAHPRTVHVADLGAVLCPGGDPDPTRAGLPLTRGTELTGAGIGTVWRWLAATAERVTS